MSCIMSVSYLKKGPCRRVGPLQTSEVQTLDGGIRTLSFVEESGENTGENEIGKYFKYDAFLDFL